MSRAAALRRILRPAALERVTAGRVVLRERNVPGGGQQTFTILIGEADIVSVRVDKFSHSSMLEGGRWKKCDYVLFVRHNDREEAVLIELKRTRTNHSSPFEQLRQSVPILAYLDALARTAVSRNEDPAKAAPVKAHYAVLYERDGVELDKQPTHAESVTASGCEAYHGMKIAWRIGRAAKLADLLVGCGSLESSA